ncbi:MAG: AAA family ATPase [Fibrobacterota bacterium]|nr:AAA family ATPase [Fibrobacterota bacterium]QQS07098.1 MAG: AAA family ATPase [Fibrobacterota bacterium]
MVPKFFRKLSSSPTRPVASASKAQAFDVGALWEGPLDASESVQDLGLDEKLRRAYFWIVNSAILSPHYDIEFNRGPSREFAIGDKRTLSLPTDQSYSSYVLLPLLTFALRRKCLMVGGPGRGKTASAMLMGVLSGMPLKTVKRSMQHGHPQMTVADLLGNPLPADLVGAQSMDDIRIAWRPWLDQPVRIIDEYNRIPTRTQSALLTVLGDNYAEVLGQIRECPEAAWYLTANDDGGGGTYEVIEALRDRVDVVVQALPFHPRFLQDLLLRIEENARPEEFVPPEIVFSSEDIDAMGRQIRELPVPDSVRRRLEHFASQLELLEAAGRQAEHLSKDTALLSGLEWSEILRADTGRDRLSDLGSQSRNGLSVRVLMTLLAYAKAMAWFRGRPEVDLTDLRQILPFVLRDKLKPDLESPFFQAPENLPLRTDRISWLRGLFDASCAEFDRLGMDRDDAVGTLFSQFKEGLEGLGRMDVKARLEAIVGAVDKIAKARKLTGPMHDDLLLLKSLHQRYTNYLNWLESQP